jgi:5-methyltetrahydropteroyltriglutamate--homocysteine methyltransferase
VADLKVSGIHTSTIGSFPLEDSVVNRQRCVEDLLDLGIDILTYPQLSDMGRQFLNDLAGCNSGVILKKGRFKLKGQEIGQDVPPPGLELFFWTLKYLEEIEAKEEVNLKAAITGPFTLASYIETGDGPFPFNTAVSNLELVRQLARILSKSCKKVSEEASVLSIDEPILGVIVGARIPFGYREEDIIETYNNLMKACGDRFVGTHICGRLSPKLVKTLLRTKLNFLSHEFHDTPENKDRYDSKELEESGKVLSVGCLSSRNPRLESPREILGVMEKFRKYGDNLIFTPDCGFKHLVVNGSKEKGYEISIEKLKNMIEAVKKFEAAK